MLSALFAAFTGAQRVWNRDCARYVRRTRGNFLYNLRMTVSGETFSAVGLGDDHAHESLFFKSIPQILGKVSVD